MTGNVFGAAYFLGLMATTVASCTHGLGDYTATPKVNEMPMGTLRKYEVQQGPQKPDVRKAPQFSQA